MKLRDKVGGFFTAWRPWKTVAVSFLFAFLGAGLAVALLGRIDSPRTARPLAPGPSDLLQPGSPDSDQFVAPGSGMSEEEVSASVDDLKRRNEEKYQKAYKAALEEKDKTRLAEIEKKRAGCLSPSTALDVVKISKNGQLQKEGMNYYLCLAAKSKDEGMLGNIKKIDPKVYREKVESDYRLWKDGILSYEKGGPSGKKAVAQLPAQECRKHHPTSEQERQRCARVGEDIVRALSARSAAECDSVGESWIKLACRAVAERNADRCADLRTKTPIAQCRRLATTVLALRWARRDYLAPISAETSSLELMTHQYFDPGACDTYKNQVLRVQVCDEEAARLKEMDKGS